MAALKCTRCGHRIFLPTSLVRCPNCGEPFAGTVGGPPAFSADWSSSASARSGFSFDTSANTDPDVIDSNQPGNVGSSPQGGFRAMGGTGGDATYPMNGAGNIQRRSQGSLFASLFSRQPQLEGVIINSQTHVETHRQHDWLADLAAIFGDIIWAVFTLVVSTSTYEKTANEESSKKNVTQLRLQSADGQMHDVRLEGDVQGGNVVQGDKLSLWGRYRKGTLLVRKGYNRTSHSTIYTNKRGISFIPLVTLAFVAALLILVFHFSHFLPSLVPSPPALR